MKKLETVLLVDDDADDNFFHQRTIMKSGLFEKVEIAKNGVDALDSLRRHQRAPDLILLDLNMPKMDGWEFLDQYNKLPEEIKAKRLYILSTSNFAEDIERANSTNGVAGYLVKPLTVQMLEDILL